jgi:hypothetical protein
MVADDLTTHATGGSGKNRPDLQEICINWCFEDASDKTAANKNLAEVLLTILKTYEVKDTGTQTLTIQAIIDAKFILHEAKSPRELKLKRWTCVHKLMSTVSLSSIKQHGDVFKKIKFHQFATDEDVQRQTSS